MAPLDFTNKRDAQDCRDAVRRTGADSELQTFDPMTGEFVTTED
jgi:hypothetical protein